VCNNFLSIMPDLIDMDQSFLDHEPRDPPRRRRGRPKGFGQSRAALRQETYRNLPPKGSAGNPLYIPKSVYNLKMWHNHEQPTCEPGGK